MNTQAVDLIDKLEAEGFQLEALQGELKVTPSKLAPQLLQQLVSLQEDVYHLLRQRAMCGGKDRLELLRVLAPKIWQVVKLNDGRSGLLWGVSPRGVMVSLGPTLPIITVDPKEIEA